MYQDCLDNFDLGLLALDTGLTSNAIYMQVRLNSHKGPFKNDFTQNWTFLDPPSLTLGDYKKAPPVKMMSPISATPHSPVPPRHIMF